VVVPLLHCTSPPILALALSSFECKILAVRSLTHGPDVVPRRQIARNRLLRFLFLFPLLRLLRVLFFPTHAATIFFL